METTKEETNNMIGRHLYIIWMDENRSILSSRKIENIVKSGNKYILSPIYPVLKPRFFYLGAHDISLYNSFLDLLNEHIKEKICYIGAIITSTRRFAFEITGITLESDDVVPLQTGHYYPYSGHNKLVFVQPIPDRKDLKYLVFSILKEGLPRNQEDEVF